ncbi:phytanoyl-CoA dioxygenase family protein [Sandaracinus amylolyticus]|uniref:Prolyl 4-hydroxylase alpha subunit Fe(2+) 2OG dioxygenase domain-containing protein n=1 Tax=Sandaracinus amylolyticus TaxID=927083 RepID=A0A0F6VYZ5_9BACT|nr:phytanoyl-CoA dioxygenase family protein [Sandaracinus amylolyticus]AKF03211.1 hypothetical protein DB32_000360 [Sandaracinus amylolyticus]
MSVASTQVAEAIRERGYALIPGLLSAAEIACARSSLERLVHAVAPEQLYAPSSVTVARPEIAASFVLTPTGLTITGLQHVAPEIAPLLLRDRLLSPLRALLGDDLRLEALGAAVSDRMRPFFGWHTHIDGEEEWTRMRAKRWPAKPTVERVIVVVYLDDLDDDGGPLLVLPRRVGDPTTPSHDTLARDWPGQVVLRPTAGTAVLLEQCTWHAAHSLRRAGHRMFVGGYFATRESPTPAFADATLDALLRGSL